MKQPIKPKYNKIDVSKLKPKKARFNNARATTHTCPSCLSTLIAEGGTWACTGDRLKIWESDFKKFKAMSKEEKVGYLHTISNQNKFFELYEKFLSGCLECDFSNRLYNGTAVYKTEIPDPMFVNKVERSLGRPLTEMEKAGADPLYLKNGKYLAEYEEGAVEVEVPMVTFPDGC